MIRPTLREYKQPKKLSEYPQATCYEAGHLVSKNAGWRSKKPVLSAQQCRGCLRCYMYCPDGVIKKGSQVPAIDYDFCKGCGICAKECPFGAIRMEEE